MNVWLYTLLSVSVISLISLIGIFFMALREELLKKLQLVLVALATGGLLGGAFFHLLPEAFESFENPGHSSLMLACGFLLFFVLERFLHWQHDHTSGIKENSIKPFGTINLVADMFHNFLDGLLIAAAFSYSTEVGLATTLAVFFHELPQEIGDFGVLIHAGFSRKKALFYNFLSACTAFLGALVVLIIGNTALHIEKYVLAFSAGAFIYLAGADLIPELHTEKVPKRSLVQFLALLVGMGLLLLLALIME